MVAVDGLLDTAVLIDWIRGYPPAGAWFTENQLKLGVTKFVWLEVIRGAGSKAKQHKAIQVLRLFSEVPIQLADVDWALEEMTKNILAHSGIDVIDALIASTAHRLQVPLFTHNEKHMKPLIGVLAVTPY